MIRRPVYALSLEDDRTMSLKLDGSWVNLAGGSNEKGMTVSSRPQSSQKFVVIRLYALRDS